jgi:hypothetical protein
MCPGAIAFQSCPPLNQPARGSSAPLGRWSSRRSRC